MKKINPLKDKLKDNRDRENSKKLDIILKMSDIELINELKDKGLPSYGRRKEKVERLRRYHGMEIFP